MKVIDGDRVFSVIGLRYSVTISLYSVRDCRYCKEWWRSHCGPDPTL